MMLNQSRKKFGENTQPAVMATGLTSYPIHTFNQPVNAGARVRHSDSKLPSFKLFEQKVPLAPQIKPTTTIKMRQFLVLNEEDSSESICDSDSLFDEKDTAVSTIMCQF